MKTEAELLAELKGLLKLRVDDPGSYAKTLRGKPLRHEFGKLVRMAQPGDELWEYEWYGPEGPWNRYDFGWCLVRGGDPIAYYSHSSS